MPTPSQLRSKAAEYAELAKTAAGPAEFNEFRKMEESLTTLAENEQWVRDHRDQTIQFRHSEAPAE